MPIPPIKSEEPGISFQWVTGKCEASQDNVITLIVLNRTFTTEGIFAALASHRSTVDILVFRVDSSSGEMNGYSNAEHLRIETGSEG